MIRSGQAGGAVVAVGLILAVGCSPPRSPVEQPEVSTTPARSPGTGTTSPPASPLSPGGSAAIPAQSPTFTSSPPASAAEQPVVSRRGALEEHAVSARLFAVRRSGGIATVNLELRALATGAEFTIGTSLNDGNPEVSSRGRTAPDGIKLIDPAHRRVYLAASSADGSCLCQPQPSQISVRRTSQVWVSVAFAEPPARVRSVDVVVPQFGTFTDVPIV